MLVTVDDPGGRGGLGAVREDGAVLNEGLVGERAIGDEYSNTGTNRESDHGAILGVKSSKNGFEF